MVPAGQNVIFVDGVPNAEDLTRVPGGDWVITSGLSSETRTQGGLFLIDRRTHTSERVYPDGAAPAPDGDHPVLTPPDPEILCAHGLSLRPGNDGVHTLYLVNHGGRETVEVFRVDAADARPALRWVGAVAAPEGAALNDVAPHPDGGFVVSRIMDGRAEVDDAYAGRPTGDVLRWHPGQAEMVPVPGSELNTPNGVEVSADGHSLFVNSWATGRTHRLALDDEGDEPAAVDVHCLPDNLTWTEDGDALLLAGQVAVPEDVMAPFLANADHFSFPFTVVRVDPRTMQATVVIECARSDLGCAATALQVADRIYIGFARGHGVAVFEAP